MAFLIDIEGSDGCGKETQSKLLCEELRNMGYEVVLQSFPEYDSISSGPVQMYLRGDFGDKSNCLNSYEASALYAVDRLCTMKMLLKKLSDNTIVVLDRYTQSNMMYQACKFDDGEEREKFLDWVDDHEFNKLHLPRPNIVLFLNVPIAASIRLMKAREQLKIHAVKDIHEKDIAYLRKAYNCAKGLCKKYQWKVVGCTDKNGDLKTREEIHANVMKAIKRELKAQKVR